MSYSWGRSDPSKWRGSTSYAYKDDDKTRDYLDKAAKASSAKGGRNYVNRGYPDSTLVDTVGKDIFTDSLNPIVIAVDVTGSMAKWPAEIFDRLPLFDQTLSQYRPDTEICFAAIGDVNSDNYPLQVNNFAKGVKLEDSLNALCAEGGGGGQVHENYELFGYFMLNHCRTPRADKPFLIIFGDEQYYDQLSPSVVRRYTGDSASAPIDSKKIWTQVADKFNVYYFQKPYGDNTERSLTELVTKQWVDALGPERVIRMPYEIRTKTGDVMPGYQRAVDYALGLISRQWGEFGDFQQNLSARQDDKNVKDSVAEVLKQIK